MISRREFNSKAALGVAGTLLGTSAKSYARIVGANDRVNFAIIGLNGRAYAHLSSLKLISDKVQITHVCDVETNILAKFAGRTKKDFGYSPATTQDFREVLASKDVDAITIATPDHWHAPMGILGLKADKHVYVEKPCSYNPAEGQLFVAAHKKYGKLVQMGTQQRSAPHNYAVIDKIHNGLIGRAYSAEAWYVNSRVSIGTGKEVPVPATLDWNMFQGPAPRRAYHDNYQPYNWHWFKAWGTGEALNNGTHEVDVCRWALGVDYPETVTASGGRYAYKDDWQYYDTISASFTYPDKMITWQSRSCNPMQRYGRDRGVLIVGTSGSVILDRDGYEVFNLAGKKVDDVKVNATQTSSTDTTGRDAMTDAHFANFVAGIQRGEKLHAPLEVGVVAVTMLQLANISWESGKTLYVDPSKAGTILNDPKAEAMTRREYEKGWEPTL
jgi:predicted dehydrogenase